MEKRTSELIEGVRASDPRAVARLITLVESGDQKGKDALSALYPLSGKARVIGVTGSPGAGKSTLVDQLASSFVESGEKVAVLAVDPSSPFSGGAVLGDRVRMNRLSEFPDVYIRSLASRGALGGLSNAVLDASVVLDVAGYKTIFVETVGVGQAEIDVVKTSDTTIVVLVPGMGDSVQAMKAGVLEIADIFVINKSDRDGSDLVYKDLKTLLSLVDFKKEDWRPPVCKTISTKREGIEELRTEVEQHGKWLLETLGGEARRKEILRNKILELVRQQILSKLKSIDRTELEKVVDQCFNKELDPHVAAIKLSEQ